MIAMYNTRQYLLFQYLTVISTVFIFLSHPVYCAGCIDFRKSHRTIVQSTRRKSHKTKIYDGPFAFLLTIGDIKVDMSAQTLICPACKAEFDVSLGDYGNYRCPQCKVVVVYEAGLGKSDNNDTKDSKSAYVSYPCPLCLATLSMPPTDQGSTYNCPKCSGKFEYKGLPRTVCDGCYRVSFYSGFMYILF